MLSRNLVMTVAPLARRAVARNMPSVSVMPSRLCHKSELTKLPTMDDLPVPCGSWQEQYDNNQRKYNIHLLLGAGIFIITLTAGIYSGAFDMYLLAPKHPAPKRG